MSKAKKNVRKKILIVDDQKDLAEIVKMGLERCGKYTAAVVTKGSNVVSAALILKPDLIILDVMMPDMDGGEVAACIRSEESLKNIPIIYLTGAVTHNEAHSVGDSRGEYILLAKPVSIEELIKRIEESLGS